MPFLRFELDALPKVAPCARAAKVAEGVIAWGLLQAWEFCWRERRTEVTEKQLEGFFGDAGDVRGALVAFDFLKEPSKPGYYPVSGVDKYLRVSKRLSEGGKAASGNLKRGQVAEPEAGAEEGDSRETAGGEPEDSRETSADFPGLTASSDQRAANSDQRVVVAAPPQPEPVSAPPGPQAPAPAQPEGRTAPRHQPLAVEKPAGEPETWGPDEFLRWTQWLLQENGFVPSLERLRDWSAWYSAALMTPGVRVRDLQAGFKAFGRDKHWEAQGFPLRGFVSQWADFVNKGRARAAG